MDSTITNAPIYLDYCATTPTDPRVVDAMLPFFTKDFGNPASISHDFGRRAAEAVEIARQHVAQLAESDPEEVVWTSGATEANNLALKCCRIAGNISRPRIITQATEHPAVLDPCSDANCTILAADSTGQIDLANLQTALEPGPGLVSIMAANNETGVLFPLKQVSHLCRTASAVLHSDASQIFGKLPLPTPDYDMLSVSSHKLYGPKGAGALIVRRRRNFRIHPLLQGGGQEHGIRSGTLNVPAIVGFGEACRIAALAMASDAMRIAQFRDNFEVTIQSALPDTVVNGGQSPRLPGVSNLAFPGIDAESLVLGLDRIAISTGSACTTASLKPSHVLQAMNLPEDIQKGSVRISFGRQTSSADVDHAASQIIRVVTRLRELATAW